MPELESKVDFARLPALIAIGFIAVKCLWRMSKMSLIPNHIKRMAMDRDLLVSVRVGRNGLTEAIVELSLIHI